MTTLKRLVSIIGAIFILVACDRGPKEWKTQNMTTLTPRLKTMFEKTKTVCFGRFLVDVPASATVSWGRASVPLSIGIYPDGVREVKALAQKFIDELKNDKAIYLNDVPLLLSVDHVTQPEGEIVTGYNGFEALDDVRINGYFRLGNDGVVFNTFSFLDERSDTVSLIMSIVRRLRKRAENEIPTEPGNCVEYAFLPDEPGIRKDPLGELVQIGFRLKEFPDTHLSISIGPSNPHKPESDSLEWQLQRLEKNLEAENPNHPRLKTKYFRRGKRSIRDWADGFEGLSRSPDQADIHSIHDFGMDFRGVAEDPFKPHADIRMQTGVANNAAGAIKPLLTDEEAVTVWDKITSTIRVRPTGAAALKSAGAAPQPRLPLGELAATGRTCPQTGVWESSEPSAVGDGRRRYVKAGEVMPRVTAPGEPSLWQKLKGQKPTYNLATVWKLVGYADVPAPSDVSAPMPSIAQAHPEPGAGDAADGANGKTAPRENG